MIRISTRRIGRRAILACATMAAALAAPVAASADVIDPAEAACSGKTAGTSCSADNVSGTCQASECCKLDYSNGTPPSSKCGPCLVCKSGGADASSGGDNGASASGDSGCSVGGQQLPPWTLPGLIVGAAALVWLRRRPGGRAS